MSISSIADWDGGTSCCGEITAPSGYCVFCGQPGELGCESCGAELPEEGAACEQCGWQPEEVAS